MTLSKALALRLIILVLLFLMFGKQAMCQDPQYSQFYANPMYTNPAFAGTSNVGRIVINARNQWPSIAGAFRSGSVSYDEHFKSINGGFGVQAGYDEQGVGTLRTTTLNLMYSYMLEVNRKFTVRMAVQAGVMQKTLDFSKLLWYDQIVYSSGFIMPTQEPSGKPSVFVTNFAAGILGYTKNFYMGFAVHNLFTPEQNFYDVGSGGGGDKNIIPRRFTANLGMIIALVQSRYPSKEVNLYPNIIVKTQKQFNQLNLGMYISKGSLVGGVYFRQNSVNADAIILLVGLRTKSVKIGYSFDATVSAARTGAVNSHEVSLAFELKKRVPKPKFPMVHCPEF